MILTCPSCATRYSVDEAKFPASGRQVRCAKCGHNWFQAGPAPVEPEAEAVVAPEPAAVPVEAAPAAQAEPAPDVPRARPSSYAATSSYAAQADLREPASWGTKLAVAAGWIGLIAVVLLIGYSAVRYRQAITVIWPQSAGVYNTLGMKVSIHGLDFDKVDSHRESEDGQVVLAVTGLIVNHGSREMPVPNVLVTLSDGSNHELYHWTFAPSAQTLKPNKSVSFITRLSSPPASARRLEVRFAKDGP